MTDSREAGVPRGEVIVYEAPDGGVRVDVHLEDARAAASRLRDDLTPPGEAGSLFGQERGDALAGILGAIVQTFGGEPLYPNVQVRTAHLLYFVIKDHPFSDGNKLIGSLLFLEFLRRNGLFFSPMASRAWRTTPSWLWRSWWPRASRRRRSS